MTTIKIEVPDRWVFVSMTKEEAHDLCRAITGFGGGIVPNFDYITATDRRLSYLYGRIQEAMLQSKANE